MGEAYFVDDPLAKKLWQSKYLDTEKLKSINKTRARYSIPPVHEDALKIKFRYSKPGYVFDTTIKVAILSAMDAMALEQFQEIYFETNEFPK